MVLCAAVFLCQVAMKARDADRLGAIRFLSAAIKQREIELRESGKEVGKRPLCSTFLCSLETGTH